QQGEECFAPALRFALDSDGQPSERRIEWLASDARKGKDGPRNAKLKVLAAMLGVDFDELKQREKSRQRRRLLVTMGAVVAIALVLAGIWEFQERKRTAAQKIAAQQRAALVANRQAELGRQSLLKGDALTASSLLETALKAAPGR